MLRAGLSIPRKERILPFSILSIRIETSVAMARMQPRGALPMADSGAAGVGGTRPSGDTTPQPSPQVFMSDLDSMPGHLFRQVHQISTAIFAEECAKVGLTSVQFAALTAIRENPDVDATRLSSLVAFDRSTLGNVLERLEAKGWILRSFSPQDKRIKVLRLSPA